MPAFRLTRPPAGVVPILCAVLCAVPVAAGAEPQAPHHAAAQVKPERPGHKHGKVVVLHRKTAPAHPAHPVHHAPPPAAAAVPVPVPAPVVPVVPPAPPKGTNTGLPLPRFASLRADAVNLRGGPGTRYPIQWVYKRRDLPVEIEREFDVWRLIEDADGVKGWVHQATLVGTRSFVILGGGEHPLESDAATPAAAVVLLPPGTAAPPGSQMLRSAPQTDAPVVAILKPGVIGRLRLCAAGSGWCRVSVKEYAGWLPRQAFWGLLPDETIQPP